MPTTINSVTGGFGSFNWEPELFDQNNKYQWCTRGENCPICNALSGRVYILDVYITASIYPGSIHPNCDCYLKQMPPDTPESDRDIFGSMLNMRNDGWLEFLFNNPSNTWWPFNTTITRALMKYSLPGMTAFQSLQAYIKDQNTGMFKDYGFFTTSSEFSWNMFKNINPDVFQTIGKILKDIYTGLISLKTGTILYETLPPMITGLAGLYPVRTTLKAIMPSTSYNNTASSFLLNKAAEAVGVASVVKKVKPYPIRGWGR